MKRLEVRAENILIIDDDLELCALVSRFLRDQGFMVDFVADGALGVARVLSDTYSLIILDVMMPETDGFEVLRRDPDEIDRASPYADGARSGMDRIKGLDLGADDYLPKPFDPDELAARIRAILRRTAKFADPVQKNSTVVVGDLEMVTASRIVRLGQKLLLLTDVEFDLLHLLVLFAGQVVSRERLTREVLGREFSPFDRSIDTHVYNLRHKMDLLSNGSERIKGIRGVGYMYTTTTVT